MADTFIGGGKMTAKLREMLSKLQVNTTVRVGILEGATTGKDNDVNAAAVAFYNEFGTSTIPSRPFMRTTVGLHSPLWGKALMALIRANDYDMEKAMGGMGMIMGEQVQKSIMSNIEPANSEATTKRKNFAGGEAMTLRDTKGMLRAVSFEVAQLGQKKINGSAG